MRLQLQLMPPDFSSASDMIDMLPALSSGVVMLLESLEGLERRLERPGGAGIMGIAKANYSAWNSSWEAHGRCDAESHH